MPTSIAVKPKKRGRPATGRDPLVGIRLPPSVIESIDAWAAERGVNRSEAIRAMIMAALEAGGLSGEPGIQGR